MRARHPVPFDVVKRAAMLMVVAAIALVGLGCSQSTDLSSGPVTTTTPKSSTTDPLDGSAGGSSAGIDQLQTLVARLLASNDTCAILTQRDVRANQLDPTLFTSSNSRQVLAQGVVNIYNHLIDISPVAIRGALQDEKDVFAQVLQVVDQYADNPTDQGATQQIDNLLKQPGMVTAQQQLNDFVENNCS
jgi:hypothetical protein